ncbi:MAG TPA: AAA family ATPase, partial [Gemmatimonadales bacterium]|nr:AAA family ATPase [Gemmatimonadales bacterium]
MTRHLRLFTLGPPVLAGEFGRIKFRTRKHFALLIRLGLECGRRFTRDYLIDLLWAEVPPLRGRHSLAQALSVLKAKVGRDRVILEKATVILADGTIDVDVAHVGEGDVEIRGPFLDGFEIPDALPFEHWKDGWRSKLAPLVRDCLVRRMDANRRAGNFRELERHARILLDVDPLSEDGVRGVVEARAWAGDRTNALKAYTRFAEQLGDELGATPRHELRAMADLLREGRPTGGRLRVAELRAADPQTASEDGLASEPLIGREREFSALYDAWQDARRARPRVVVVTGDAGIGKTTLVNAVAAMCQLEGAAVARVQAYDAERELPFAVLAELTRQLAVQRVLGGAEPEALSELARIAPELLEVFPGVAKPPVWTAEVTPLRLADAFRKAVAAAGEDRPVILVVDDVHATDNATAAVLHVVARKLHDTRVLLVLAGRSTELGAPDATKALTNDTVIKHLTRVELEGLDASAAAHVVQRLLGERARRPDDPP